MANFSSFTKTSTNITATLKEAAKDRGLKTEEVDFDLLGVETLIKSENHIEWTIIEEPLEKIFSEEAINSPELLIRQEYQIRVRPFIPGALEALKIELAFNKAKSKVVATFKKGSILPYHDKLAQLLKREVYRKKLRAGFLIGHFEEKLNASLIKLTKTLPCNIALSKDIKIIVAQSSGAVYPTNDNIILHYKADTNFKKSMLEGVHPDTLIFEYIKPIFGHNGRSCNGEIIEVPEPIIAFDNYYPDDETIYIKESDKSIKYYSKIDGYVKNSDNEISISNEITMESATFRKNQSIDTGEDKDIFVNIQYKGKTDDAVGSGVVMNVKEINVYGTVGTHAKVRAQKINIAEQTHRNAQLEAIENAKIHLHRGNLKAKIATIEILENGKVIADEVYVQKMLGGEIIAHKVYIQELTSNTTITASELIEIELITGEQNRLIIDPDKIEDYHEKVSLLQSKIKEETKLLKANKDEHETNVAQHRAELPRIKVFQQRSLAATKQGKTPNKTDILRIKQYKKKMAQLQEEADLLSEEEQKILDLTNELEKLYEAELHAKIINKGSYDGHTRVSFVDVKTSQEYTMLPEGIYKELYLQNDGDEKKISW